MLDKGTSFHILLPLFGGITYIKKCNQVKAIHPDRHSDCQVTVSKGTTHFQINTQRLFLIYEFPAFFSLTIFFS